MIHAIVFAARPARLLVELLAALGAALDVRQLVVITVRVVAALIVIRPAILSAHPVLAAPLANRTVEPAVIKNAAICVPLIVARPVKALVEQCAHPHAVLPVKMLAARNAKIEPVLTLVQRVA